MSIIQTVVVTVQANNPQWTDTGLTLGPGESLRVRASGMVVYGSGSCAFPEGVYAADTCNPEHTYDPTAVVTYAAYSTPDYFVVTNTFPVSLNMVLRAPGVVPANAQGSTDDGTRVTRDITYGPSLDTGRVWLIFNDGEFGDNSGAFTVTIDRMTETPPVIDVGSPSPLRPVPPAILAMKGKREQSLTWCLALKPLTGPWEAYTGYDRPLQCPRDVGDSTYTDELGNVTPRLNYMPAVGAATALPVALRLDTNAGDASIFAPKDTEDLPPALLFLDRAKILRHYYDGGFWEFFEVIPDETDPRTDRFLWNCGTVGNIQFDDLIAVAELTGYEDMANNDVGDEYHVLCQVGARRVGDRWGEGRCLNLVLLDGPNRDDFTVLATVETADWSELALSYGTHATSGALLDEALFQANLAAADIVFGDAPDGGANAGYPVKVKSGARVSDGHVTITTKLSLPLLPSVGDKLLLTAGCRKTKTACLAWSNLENMQAQDLPSVTDLMRHYAS